jgi:hypothetical protein
MNRERELDTSWRSAQKCQLIQLVERAAIVKRSQPWLEAETETGHATGLISVFPERERILSTGV